MTRMYETIDFFLTGTLGFEKISIVENEYLRNEAVYLLNHLLKTKHIELDELENHGFLKKKISLEKYIERIEAICDYQVNGYFRHDVSGDEYVIIEEKTLYFDTINDCSGIGEQLTHLQCIKANTAI